MSHFTMHLFTFHKLFTLALALALSIASQAGELRLQNGKPFCVAYQCDQMFWGADRFQPPEYVTLPIIEAYRGERLLGYLFLSTDLVDIPAYSGKPIVTLIAIDPKGIILDAAVVHHSEPILLVGIPPSALDDFLSQYIGHCICDQFEVASSGWLSRSRRPSQPIDLAWPEDEQGIPALVQVDMITGATVTAQIMDRTLLTSARIVAEAIGLIEREETRIVSWNAEYVDKSWHDLVREGSIGHLFVSAAEFDRSAATDTAWIDLYFGDLTQPVVGQNILGEAGYNWLKDNLPEGDKAIFVVSNGIDTFKGSGFVRGGIFERFYLQQGNFKYSFRDLDYEHLYSIKAAGAPTFKETGLFFLRESRFDSSLPWRFYYVGNRLTGETARSKIFKTFSTKYQLPQHYFDVQLIIKNKAAAILSRIWSDHILEVISLSVFLSMVMGLFFCRGWLTASAKRLDIVHTSVLITSVLLIGFLLKSPPSIAHLYPLARVFVDGFRWDLYLSDPIQFVFWCFIAVSLILWGRGWFCGWICPYGALIELAHRVQRWISPTNAHYQFPVGIDNVLRRVRYVVFIALAITAVLSLETAERLTEIEPFKTTWLIGLFNRDWYLISYWLILFGLSVFIYRFFCRYLCPLGAIFSIGSFLQLTRIKRRDFCSNCNVCAKGCNSRSIDKKGQINRYECYSCLECEQTYTDEKGCPAILNIKKHKETAVTDFDRTEIIKILSHQTTRDDPYASSSKSR